MAPRLSWRFDGRPSAARSWDIRFRVAATGVVSAAVLAAPGASLLPLGMVVTVLLGLARSTWRQTARVVVSFSGFLVFFFALGLAFEPTVSQAQFLGLQAARLTLLLLLGHFLFLSATPADVTEGIRWYLGWLGARRAWVAASMAGWALGAVPLVLDQAHGLSEAAALRGLTARRPGRLVRLLTLGLLVRTVERSTDLALALEARGFGQAVPPLRLRARGRDAAALVAVGVASALAWAFGSILTP